METKIRANPRSKLVELNKQLAAVLKEWFAAELPMSKRRKSRDGNGAPLTAWMAGAPRNCESKIGAVCDGRARYPYKTIGDGAKVLVDRIAYRYQVTWAQRVLIESYVLSQYRGRSKYLNWGQSGPLAPGVNVFGSSQDIKMALAQACERIGKLDHDIPLGALIDPRVTNILLLVELTANTRRT